MVWNIVLFILILVFGFIGFLCHIAGYRTSSMLLYGVVLFLLGCLVYPKLA